MIKEQDINKEQMTKEEEEDKKVKISLEPCERETHITISDDEPNSYDIYTAQKKMMKHLKSIGLTPYRLDKIEGEIVGEYYKVPYEQLLIRKERKKVEYSDERREQLREHMKTVHENRK